MNYIDNTAVTIVIEEITKLEKLCDNNYIKKYLNDYKYYILESLYMPDINYNSKYQFIALNNIVKKKINGRFDLEINRNSSTGIKKILYEYRQEINDIVNLNKNIKKKTKKT